MSDETNIGGVNISDVSGGTIQTGDITTKVTAGGDLVGRDKITHYHLHFRDKQAEIKPPIPHLPTPYWLETKLGVTVRPMRIGQR
jgi:hypothetical protein